MQIVWMALLLAAAAGKAPAPPDDDRCVELREAAGSLREMRERNRKSFEKALAARGLVLTRLAPASETRTAEFSAQGRTSQDGGRRFVAGRMTERSDRLAVDLFVRDRAGKVSLVLLDYRMEGRTIRTMDFCECRAACGASAYVRRWWDPLPMPVICSVGGGARYRPSYEQRFYEIGPKDSVGAPVELAFKYEDVFETRPKACPDPP